MCGRYTNQYSWAELKELYDLTTPYLTSNFEPRYNIAPTQKCLVVRLNEQGQRELVEMVWGLVPSWSKDGKPPGSTINAKCETVATKPAYRGAFKSRPCLVVADGFYEWLKISPTEKQPYFITTKDREPFAFAGLWERWKPRDVPPGTAPLETFAILTCEPNAAAGQIHDRMPVMLEKKDWDAWLGTPEQRTKLMKAFPAARMELWPVGKPVGNPRNQGPQLIKRIEVTP
jgi:putative SOS response-associated peptidase YedK